MRRHKSAPTLKSLTASALQHWDSDDCWAAINTLRRRAEPQTVSWAQKMFGSGNWRKRSLAVNVVCQLQVYGRNGPPNQVEQSLAILYSALRDPHLQVVASALYGFGHRHCAEAASAITPWADHHSAEIRYAVAFALGGYDEGESVTALLHLAADPDSDVRDWATFSLGTQCSVDTPEVREQLWRNMQDANVNVRGEALAGLAQRHDERAVAHLLVKLTGDDYCGYDLSAVEVLADVRLYPLLQRHEASFPEGGDEYLRSLLHDAMLAFQPGNQQ